MMQPLVHSLTTARSAHRSSRLGYLLSTLLGLAVLLQAAGAQAQTPERPAPARLWVQDAPGATGTEPKDVPTLTAYRLPADGVAKPAVVVLPGGGYGGLAVNHEGHEIAAWLNEHGIQAFICEYRHRGRGYGHPHPQLDAQRAIRTVRANAEAWEVDGSKIGVIGFSAGGHLASTVATHFDAGNPDSDDPIDRVGCRPDFAILCYPVIAFDEPFTHRGSQNNLLGRDADPELVRKLSNEKSVTAENPPTFLWHTSDDQVVAVDNAIVFYQALRKANVAAELHVFETGRHGLGLARGGDAGTALWPELCLSWMRRGGWLGE